MATNVSTTNLTGEDYASIALWESDTDNDLVTAGDIEVLDVYNDDGTITVSSAITFGGATTNSSNYRVIRAKSGDGWEGDCNATSPVTINYTTSYAFTFDEDYFRVDGLRFTSNSASIFCFGFNADHTVIQRCFFDGRSQSFDVSYITSNEGIIHTRCLWLETDDYGFDNTSGDGDNYLSNCTLYGGTYGPTSWGSGRLIYNNSISVGNTDNHYADALANWQTGTGYNMMGGNDYYPTGALLNNATAQDTTTPTSGNRVMYVDLTADDEDFHLIDNEYNDAIEYGTTLTGIQALADASGETPSGTWDIGAFCLGSASTEYTKTTSANGILEKTNTKTTSANGLLEEQDITLTSSANALLEEQDITVTTSVDGSLNLALFVTTSGDGILKLTDITTTTAAGGYLQTDATEITTSAEALLELHDLTTTTSGDGFLEAVQTDAKVAIFESTTGTSTGTRSFTSAKLGGDTCKGGIFFCTNATASSASVVDARMSIGWTDGTTHFSTSQNTEDDQASTDTARLDEAHLITATVPGTNNVSGRMAFSGLATNGITGNITTAMEADYVVKCIMFSGSSDCSVKSGNIAGVAPNSTSNVTDVGFEPDLVFLFTHDFSSTGSSGNDLSCNLGVAFNNGGTVEQRSIQYYSDSGQGAAETEGVFSADYACGTVGDYQCEISDFDSAGFSLTARDAGSQRVFYLAVKLTGWNLSLFDYTVPTSTGTQAHSTPGFQPDVVIEGFTRNTSVDTNQTTGEATAWGVALSDASDEHTISITEEDGADPTVTYSKEYGTGLQIYEDDGATVAALSTIDSFDSDGYTRDWTTVPTTGFKVWSLCLGAESSEFTTYTATTSVNGLLEALDSTTTTSANALLEALDTTLTTSSNALLATVNTTLTSSVDGLLTDESTLTIAASGQLSQTDITLSTTGGGVLEVIDTELLTTTNAILTQALTVNTLVNSVLVAHQTVNVSHNGMLQTLDTTVTTSVGGQLISGSDLLLGVDGYLKSFDHTLTASADSALSFFDLSLTTSANAQLTSGAALTLNADSLLQETHVANVSFDGELVLPSLNQTIATSGNSVLKFHDLSTTYSVNAYLALVNTEITSAEGFIKAEDRTRDCAGDGVLYDPTTSVYTAVARAALNTSTGTQQITTTNFGGITPKAAIQITTYATTNATEAAHAVMSIGFTDGTDDVCMAWNSEDAQGTTDTTRGMSDDFMRLNLPGILPPDCEAAFSSFVTNGIEINLTSAPDAAYLTHMMLFGGTPVEAKVGTIVTGQPGTEQTITGVGFEPDVVFIIDCDRDINQEVSDNFGSFGVAYNGAAIQQRAITFEDDEGDSSTNARGEYLTSYAAGQVNDYRIELGNFGADGFSVWTQTAGANSIGYLAIKLTDKTLSLTTLQTQAFTGNQEIDLDVNPDMVIAGISMSSTQNTLNTNGDTFPVGLWMADGTDEFCTWMRSEDAADPTDCGSYSADSLIVHDHTGSAAFNGSLGSFDGDGLTIDWTAVDATPRYWWMLVIGADVSTSSTIGCTVSGFLSKDTILEVGAQGWLESVDLFLLVAADGQLTDTHTLTTSVDGTITASGNVLTVDFDALLGTTSLLTTSCDGSLQLSEGLIRFFAEGYLVIPGAVTCSVDAYLLKGNTILVDGILQKPDQTVSCGVNGFILREPGEWDTVEYPDTPTWNVIT